MPGPSGASWHYASSSRSALEEAKEEWRMMSSRCRWSSWTPRVVMDEKLHKIDHAMENDAECSLIQHTLPWPSPSMISKAMCSYIPTNHVWCVHSFTTSSSWLAETCCCLGLVLLDSLMVMLLLFLQWAWSMWATLHAIKLGCAFLGLWEDLTSRYYRGRRDQSQRTWCGCRLLLEIIQYQCTRASAALEVAHPKQPSCILVFLDLQQCTLSPGAYSQLAPAAPSTLDYEMKC